VRVEWLWPVFARCGKIRIHHRNQSHTPASRSEATVEAAGFIGVPGKPLLLAGVILNPPK
jgi:hypothetical protein